VEAAEGALPLVNHFVLAERTEGAGASTVTFGDDVRACAAHAYSLGDGEVALFSSYMEMGYSLTFTDATGDCAPDSIAAHLGVERGPVSWKQIRGGVSEALLRLRHEEWFKHAWRACQELPENWEGAPSCFAGADPGDGQALEEGGGAEEGKNEGDKEGAKDDDGGAAQEEGDATSAMQGSDDEGGAAKEGSDATSVSQESDDDGGAAQEAEQVVEWALARTSEGQKILDIDGGLSLADVLALEDLAELRMARGQAACCPSSLAGRKARPPKNCSTTTQQRLALGREFANWVESATSVAPLHDYCVLVLGYERGHVPKKTRVHLSRCYQLVQQGGYGGRGPNKGGRAQQGVLWQQRRRSRGLTGFFFFIVCFLFAYLCLYIWACVRGYLALAPSQGEVARVVCSTPSQAAPRSAPSCGTRSTNGSSTSEELWLLACGRETSSAVQRRRGNS
jgi:hypothetical protein